MNILMLLIGGYFCNLLGIIILMELIDFREEKLNKKESDFFKMFFTIPYLLLITSLLLTIFNMNILVSWMFDSIAEKEEDKKPIKQKSKQIYHLKWSKNIKTVYGYNEMEETK